MEKINATQHLDIIARYLSLEPMASIAKVYGVTRARIYQILRANSVDTKKGMVTIICDCCGASFQRNKCRLRKPAHRFCSIDCYSSYLSANKIGQLSRHGQRIARSVVSKHYPLSQGEVVHHLDGDDLNNNIVNLVVFKSQSDHLKYHRTGEPAPHWSF